MAIRKLIFVDTNIWLDFYRARTDAGLSLLNHLEQISNDLIVTYQLEMEFKKNRQVAILEGLQELKSPSNIPRPGLLSDAKAYKALQTSIKLADARVKSMRSKMKSVIESPTKHDPVYQACQRMFHANSNLILTRENNIRRKIRSLAYRRFLHGCPPRKKNDTSFGDSFNWEWMVECALKNQAELVIVSRDADYGIVYENKAYINDHLKHEFSERVSQKRKIVLHTKLSDALKLFAIPITAQEVIAEEQIIESARATAETTIDGAV